VRTKWASILRLILEEQTTPKDNLLGKRWADAGGIPVGVIGRGRREPRGRVGADVVAIVGGC
jgi:hypothetical protein